MAVWACAGRASAVARVAPSSSAMPRRERKSHCHGRRSSRCFPCRSSQWHACSMPWVRSTLRAHSRRFMARQCRACGHPAVAHLNGLGIERTPTYRPPQRAHRRSEAARWPLAVGATASGVGSSGSRMYWRLQRCRASVRPCCVATSRVKAPPRATSSSIAADLDRLALLEHYDDVGVADGRKAVRDHERGAALAISRLQGAFWILASVTTSSALVASSRIRIGGFFSSARAMERRCRSPPESVAPRSPTWVL